jgi:large conductance mechanosensitive channel
VPVILAGTRDLCQCIGQSAPHFLTSCHQPAYFRASLNGVFEQEKVMAGKIKSLWNEFIGFAFKGNMLDLAVGIVIGGAFTTVVTAMVNDVVMPTVNGIVMPMINNAATAATNTVAKVTGASTQPTTMASSQPSVAGATPAPAAPQAPAPSAPSGTQAAASGDKTTAPPPMMTYEQWHIGPILIGQFLAALLNFVILAASVFFMIVKVVGWMSKSIQKPTAPAAITTKECPMCLSVIPIKAKKCAHCTADLPVTA